MLRALLVFLQADLLAGQHANALDLVTRCLRDRFKPTPGALDECDGLYAVLRHGSVPELNGPDAKRKRKSRLRAHVVADVGFDEGSGEEGEELAEQ